MTTENETRRAPEARPSHDWATAVFAGGCFWCLEPIFSSLHGVRKVVPGYTGGHAENPTYEEVCTDQTGHAESVQITYDPSEIRYRDLLTVFFSVHDPTTLNRQGHDIGSQYRSAIFYANEAQRAEAQDVLNDLTPEVGWEGSQVVTELKPLVRFYPAEAHHQDYFRRNPTQGYCQAVIAPKVAKFQKRFAVQLEGVTRHKAGEAEA